MEPTRKPPVEAHDVNDVHEALESAAELLRVHDELQAQAEEYEEAAEDASQARPDPQLQAQNLEEIRALLEPLHPADVAYILEALPREQRLVVWDLVKADRDGEILLEVSDAVRESLIEYMDDHELVAATGQLDTDEIADLAPDLPDDVMADVYKALPVEEREQLRAAMHAHAREGQGFFAPSRARDGVRRPRQGARTSSHPAPPAPRRAPSPTHPFACGSHAAREVFLTRASF